MPIRGAKPFRWSPKGCSDTLDTTEVFVGAMEALTNLIPDPTTMNLWVPRPAATQKTAFAGFTTPGFVSCLQVIGDRAYGMVASGRTAGHDEPFVYDLVADAFITVSGVTAANVPTSPASTGAWTPPTMALVGTILVFTHPGFSGANFVGFLNISNPSAPAWSAGNTATNALPVAPSFVAQFNGRAWYGCNPATGQPGLYFSDALVPGTITNATQVLTFDDNLPLKAAAGLPLDNQLGGVIQSLIVFKANNTYQVTGDSATSNLAKNALNVATGTSSPLSIVSTPKGLAFVAPDGLRIIDFAAHISDPVGLAGTGVTRPFSAAVIPSRIVAACNATTIRISTQNGAVAGNPQQEWWYDIARQNWCGPHTFPASAIAAWGLSFVMAPIGVTGSLWKSDVIASSTTTYVENSAQMTFRYETPNFPDLQTMSMYNMAEAYIYAGYAPGAPAFFATAEDQDEQVIASASISTPSGTLPLWGAVTWGAFLWGGQGQAMAPRRIPWPQPIVFSRAHVFITGNCGDGVRLGDLYCKLQALGYLPPT